MLEKYCIHPEPDFSQLELEREPFPAIDWSHQAFNSSVMVVDSARRGQDRQIFHLGSILSA
jgi:hypothetical protein